MYTQHFGLDNELFDDGIATDTAVYYGSRRKVLAANLTIALTRRDSVAVVYGAAGTGKTTTVSHALREMTTRLALGTLTHPPLTPHELLEQLLCEFGFSPYKNSRSERLQMWRQFLSEMAVTETRVCVLVENAQSLDVEVLKALDSLTAADANGCPGANVVLTATAAPEALLVAPELAALRQRMRLQTTLKPFGIEETCDYLRFSIEAAGGEYANVFADDAAEAIQAFSGGIVRVINNIVESALSIAATRREPRLTAALVARVAVGLFGIPAAQLALAAQAGQAPPEAGSSPAERLTGTSDASAAERPGGRAQATSASGAEPSTPEEPTGTHSSSTAGPSDPARTEPADSTASSPAVQAAAENRSVDAVPAAAASPSARSEAPSQATARESRETAAERQPTVAPEPPPSPPVMLEPVGIDLDVPTLTDSIVMDDPESDEALEPGDATETGRARGRRAAETLEELELDGLEFDLPGLADAGDGGTGVPEHDRFPAFQTGAAANTESSARGELRDDDNDESPELDEIDDNAGIDRVAAAVLEEPDAASGTPMSGASHDDISYDELMEAFANARALEDISNSMAETLFGDAELEQLAATLSVRVSEAAESSKSQEEASDDSPLLSGTRRL